MSLPESVLKKLSKNEIIALALEYQSKFDSTLTNMKKKYLASGKIVRKCSQNLTFPDKSSQNWGSKLFCRNNSAGITVSTPDVNVYSIGIRSPVYINDSLYKYFKMLWWKCKKLCVNKLVHLFWVSNGSIRLKVPDNEKSYMISKINDLEELFPGN